MTHDDHKLVEDCLPIKAISKEASHEKSVRKGNISTLHLSGSRRSLVLRRATDYREFVPADQFELQNGLPKNEKALTGLTAKRDQANYYYSFPIGSTFCC
jgi:putative DNA methylase